MASEEENKMWDQRSKCSRYEGYYFYPRKELEEQLGLIALTFEERRDLYASPGLYNACLYTKDDIDFQCAMDNSRTPTHRTSEAKPPEYGSGILPEFAPQPILSL